MRDGDAERDGFGVGQASRKVAEVVLLRIQPQINPAKLYAAQRAAKPVQNAAIALMSEIRRSTPMKASRLSGMGITLAQNQKKAAAIEDTAPTAATHLSAALISSPSAALSQLPQVQARMPIAPARSLL